MQAMQLGQGTRCFGKKTHLAGEFNVSGAFGSFGDFKDTKRFWKPFALSLCGASPKKERGL